MLIIPYSGLMWQELKKLGLPKEDFRFSKLSEELVLNPADPVENVRMYQTGEKMTTQSYFPQLKCHFLPPSFYLRPTDLDFCLENTDFSEEEILQWFRKFRSNFGLALETVSQG